MTKNNARAGRPSPPPTPTGSAVHDPIRDQLYAAMISGHSQADIAALCGVKQATVSMYLRGDRVLRDPALSRLVRWLDSI